MRHSRSILAAALALSAAACGQGATEPSALTTISDGTRAPSPSFNVGEGGGWGGGQVVETESVGSLDGTQGDSTTIVGPGDGGNRGGGWGGGQ